MIPRTCETLRDCDAEEDYVSCKFSLFGKCQ